MFTNKAKFFCFVAVLIVVVIVASALIATSANDNLMGSLDQNSSDTNDKLSDLEKSIKALNETIKGLNKGLNSYEDVIKKQEALLESIGNAGVKIEDWNGATEAYQTKMIELAKVLVDFEARKDSYGRDIDETLVYDEDYYAVSRALEQQAFIDMSRATSVAQMDEIIAGLLADLEAIPTKAQKTRDAVAAIELDDVTASDRDNIILAFNLLNSVPADFFELDEKAALVDRFEATLVAYANVVVAEFVAQVQVLPKNIAMSHEKAINDALGTQDLIDIVYSAQTDAEVKAAYTTALAGEDYAKAVMSLNSAAKRMRELNRAKKAADEINEDLEAYKKTNITLSFKVLEELRTFDAVIAAWAEQYGIVSDAKSEDYIAENYNLVNHSVLEGFNTSYTKAAATLKTAADKYISAVQAIPAKSQNSVSDFKAAIDAATKAMTELKKIKAEGKEVTVENADKYLELTEGNRVADYVEIFNAQNETYKQVAELVGKVEDYVNKTIRYTYCADTKTHTGNVKCDCKTKIDYTKIKSAELEVIDGYIKTLINDYDYTEKIIPAATLKEYKQVRLYLVALEAKNQINATAKAVNSKTATDLAKKYCEEIDKIVATDYVLDVRMSNKNEWSSATRAPIKNIEELVDKATAEIKGK